MACITPTSLSRTFGRQQNGSSTRKLLEHEIMVKKLAAWKAKKSKDSVKAIKGKNCPSSSKRHPLVVGETTQLVEAQNTSKKDLLTYKRSLPPKPHSSKTAPPPREVKPTILSEEVTPRKCLFRQPTPRRNNTCRAAGRSSVGLDKTPAVQERPRGGGTSLKRHTVRFARTTPERCSPRLSERSKGMASKENVSTTTTPKHPWQDRTVDMSKRLEMWLSSRGKTPSRYSSLVNFQQTPADLIRLGKVHSRRVAPPKNSDSPVWQLSSDASASVDTSIVEEEVMAALNQTMDECFLLLESGYPTPYVSEWLDNLVAKVSVLNQCARYWLCKITIAQDESRDTNDVINIYESAVRAGAQPINEVKESLVNYVKGLVSSTTATSEDVSSLVPSCNEVDQLPPDVQTPGRPRAVPAVVKQLLQSSVLKYCLTESTPYFDRIRRAIGDEAQATPLQLSYVTPVRRSIRLEGRRSFLPANLQEHDVCLASLDQLSQSGPKEFILRTNCALDDRFLDGEQGGRP